jgi:hypothetical protein
VVFSGRRKSGYLDFPVSFDAVIPSLEMLYGFGPNHPTNKPDGTIVWAMERRSVDRTRIFHE